ncbi:MAG: DUF45 domain-containing protein [Turneriella sp.]|nr:DUF45 domain-containing protein [Turneriella sp.]
MTTDLKRSFDVEIVASRARARSASLRYTPGGKFVLSVPAGTPEKWVQEFLLARRGWMEKTLQKAERLAGLRRITEGAVIETGYYSLQVFADANLRYPQYRVVRDNKERNSIFHLAPEFFLAENAEKLYLHLEKYLLSQLVKFGSAALLERARYWANLHKIEVKDFFVRVQKSRLGYCTFDDRIMLNGRLLFASQRLQDYVICHELAHTKHKNHSKRFWAYLEKLFPGAKAADKLLRDSAAYSMRTSPRPAATPLLKERGSRRRNSVSRSSSGEGAGG